MIFASSDNSDPNLHPKLEVCYSLVSSVAEENNNNIALNVFPNPASQSITIDLSNFKQELVSIEISNNLGQIINHSTEKQSNVVVDVSDYVKGLYFVKVNFGDFIAIKKIIIE
jgi:hypothetical protein